MPDAAPRKAAEAPPPALAPRPMPVALVDKPVDLAPSSLIPPSLIPPEEPEGAKRPKRPGGFIGTVLEAPGALLRSGRDFMETTGSIVLGGRPRS